jgi:hypothetical protein
MTVKNVQRVTATRRMGLDAPGSMCDVLLGYMITFGRN